MYLVFCLVQGEAMTVQMFLHCLEGLFDVAIPFQQLTYKDAHLILEVLRGPPLLLDYPLQLCYPSFGPGEKDDDYGLEPPQEEEEEDPYRVNLTKLCWEGESNYFPTSWPKQSHQLLKHPLT